jgi:hypothetical protein
MPSDIYNTTHYGTCGRNALTLDIVSVVGYPLGNILPADKHLHFGYRKI